MEVVVNGERREVDPDLTVGGLIAALQRTSEARGVAVAVDGEVVPRGAWDETALWAGARVEILAAVQGG